MAAGGRRVLKQDARAVSSTVGTVLLIGITLTVMSAVSLVVLDRFSEDQSSKQTDIAAASEQGVVLTTLQSGEALDLPPGRFIVNVDGVEQVRTFAEASTQFGWADTWNIGEDACFGGPDPSCFFSGQDVRGVLIIHDNALIMEEGQRASSGAALPDLTVAITAVTPPTPAAGASVTFTVQVSNAGPVAIPAGQSINVDFFVNGALLNFDTRTAGLAAGASYQVLSNAFTAAPGNTELKAVVDGLLLITELSEGNNQVVQTLGVLAPGQPWADLDNDGTFSAGDIPIDLSIPLSPLDAQQACTTMGTPCPGAGLVIPADVGGGACLALPSIDWAADGTLTVLADLCPTDPAPSGDSIRLRSRQQDVNAIGVTFTSPVLSDAATISITASIGGIDLGSSTLLAGGDVSAVAGGALTSGAGVSIAGTSITSALADAVLTATSGTVDASNAAVTATTGTVGLTSGGNIGAAGATLRGVADKAVTLTAGSASDSIDVTSITVQDGAGAPTGACAAPQGVTITGSPATGTVADCGALSLDPGEAYRDMDGDGEFTPGIDVPVPNVEFTDGIYDAYQECLDDGGTPATCAGVGFVIPESAGDFTADSIAYYAEGEIVIGVGITVQSRHVCLESKDSYVDLRGVTLAATEASGSGLPTCDPADCNGDAAEMAIMGQGVIMGFSSTSPSDQTDLDAEHGICIKGHGFIEAPNTLMDAKQQITFLVDGAHTWGAQTTVTLRDGSVVAIDKNIDVGASSFTARGAGGSMILTAANDIDVTNTVLKGKNDRDVTLTVGSTADTVWVTSAQVLDSNGVGVEACAYPSGLTIGGDGNEAAGDIRDCDALVLPAGNAFEDANGNGIYDAGDTPIPGWQVADGEYDAGNSGLVIPADIGTINTNKVDFQAKLDIIIKVDIEVTNGGDNDLKITSDNGNIDVRNIRLENLDTNDNKNIELDAKGKILAQNSRMFVNDGGSKIILKAEDDIHLENAEFRANNKKVEVDAKNDSNDIFWSNAKVLDRDGSGDGNKNNGKDACADDGKGTLVGVTGSNPFDILGGLGRVRQNC